MTAILSSLDPGPMLPLFDEPEILLDPHLGKEQATVLAETAGRAGALAILCESGRELMEAARPGTVAVLADPRPALVEVLVLWGVTVVAVRGASPGSARWLAEVVDAGASAALVRPDSESLALALGTLLRDSAAS